MSDYLSDCLRELIRSRRSVRKFQSNPVNAEVLERIISSALWAPSGENKQPWHIVVVTGDKKDQLIRIISQVGAILKPRLESMFPEKVVHLTLRFFENAGGAPVLILVYIPKVRVFTTPEMTDAERYAAEIDRMINLQSASALIQNLLLLAHSEGLGTCWMTGPLYVAEDINRYLGITEMELVAAIPVGYPDQCPPVPKRKGNPITWIGFAT